MFHTGGQFNGGSMFMPTKIVSLMVMLQKWSL